MSSLEALGPVVAAAGPWLLPLLFAASLIEYLFPPFPGDSVVLVGSALAVAGAVPVWALLVTCLVGSFCGAAIDFAVGRWLRRRLDDPTLAPRWRRWLPPERVAQLRESYRRHGDWLVLTNRVVPVSRGFLFVFAGLSGMGFARTMALGAVSSLVWNALLLAAASWVGARLDRLETLARSLGLWGLLLVVAVALVVLGWRRRRAARPIDAAGPPADVVEPPVGDGG